MKHRSLFGALVAVLLSTVSCGPSKYVLDIEMRKPSRSGIDLVGKNVSVVFLEEGKAVPDSFNSGMANAFASSLEKSYGWREGSVGVYKIPMDEGADYACRDSMLNLVISTDADLVFLFDRLLLGEQSHSQVQFSMKLHCYDGMNPADKVQTYTGTSRAEMADSLSGIKAGEQVSLPFQNQWKVEQFSFLYFDSQTWYDALMKAEQFDWKGAMDIWMELLSSNDPLKRSCAEYNIATACLIAGNLPLAAEWLDRSDLENKLPLSDTLRKRISTD